MADISKPILVIGGGISGMTAAVEAAEVGAKVILVEKNPYLGGRVAQLNQYFPKLCPPSCGLEINFKRIKNNPDITVYTDAEVSSVSGSKGSFDVSIKINPQYVNDNCTACGDCEKVCGAETSDSFNYGLARTKAIHLPNAMALPYKYTYDAGAGLDDLRKCVAACKYNAIDPDAQAKTVNATVGSIVVATGWQPYDITKLDNLGGGNFANVVTNVQLERLAASNGPTGGRIQRPGDGAEIKSIAFVQCAGSRDVNHLGHCSSVCCLASLKQSTYVREQFPDAEITMFYIDVRALGRLEDFYQKVTGETGLKLVKGKVAKITEAPGGDLNIEAEDTLTGKKSTATVNMVVLATGMQPSVQLNIPGAEYDEFGFLASDPEKTGIVAAGCAGKPVEVAQCVQDATGAALKAIQSAR